ncbi:hypothetical protein Y023_5703 [Burkholderia pseudomallei A79D]|nr:hypothetical protein Y023_5703 [Burkholderia pseudomallei A79D]
MKHKPLRASQFVLPSKIPRQNVPSENRGISRPRRQYRTTNAPSIPSVERRGTELIPARPANFSMHHTVRAPADNVRFPLKRSTTSLSSPRAKRKASAPIGKAGAGWLQRK